MDAIQKKKFMGKDFLLKIGTAPPIRLIPMHLSWGGITVLYCHHLQ
jgi:hypothetical protein